MQCSTTILFFPERYCIPGTGYILLLLLLLLRYLPGSRCLSLLHFAVEKATAHATTTLSARLLPLALSMLLLLLVLPLLLSLLLIPPCPLLTPPWLVTVLSSAFSRWEKEELDVERNAMIEKVRLPFPLLQGPCISCICFFLSGKAHDFVFRCSFFLSMYRLRFCYKTGQQVYHPTGYFLVASSCSTFFFQRLDSGSTSV